MFTKQGGRVETEAAVLAGLRHPGVVELAGMEDGLLRTRWVEGRPLTELGPLPADEMAGLVAAVAATVADLHEAGVVHGGIDATHVLVDAEGRPVLCSFGRGGDPPDDVAALGRLLGSLAAGSQPSIPARPGGRRRRPLGAMLAPPASPALAELAARATGDVAGRPSARELSAAIHRRVPGARLPRPRVAPLLPPPPTGLTARTVAAGLGVGAVLAAVVAWFVVGRPGASVPAAHPVAAPPTTTAAPTTTADTAADTAVRVWPAPTVAYADGVLTVDGIRYAVGQPGDQVVAGDWACRGGPALALLRPASGDVFAFDAWAEPDREVAARLVGRVDAATGLQVADVDDDGCDDLLATRPGAEPVPVPVPPPVLSSGP